MPGLPVAAALAFTAGLLSFLSPCVLPLVPVYLGHLAGASAVSAQGTVAARVRAVPHAASFVLGFSVVFTGVWITLGLLGLVVADVVYRIRPVAGLALVVLGLHYAGLLPLRFLYRDLRLNVRAPGGRGLFRSFVIGTLFAAGWTPCIGPVLAGIITLAASQDTLAQGSLLLWAYAAGLGLPFLATAAALQSSMRVARWIGRREGLIRVAAGGMLVLLGMLVLSGTFVQLSSLRWPTVQALG